MTDPVYEEQLREISVSYIIPSKNISPDAATSDDIWEAIRKGAITNEKPVRRIGIVRYWWAAAVLLLLAGTAIWFMQQRSPMENRMAVSPSGNISPGSTGAILTLANGQKILLDSAQNGIIAHQPGAAVRLKNGQVDYDTRSSDATMLSPGEKVTNNTISTPRGKQFKLILPDGTKVWLNAASSLTFPTAFAGKERKVEVTGEAYFEVVANTQKPFLVKINDKTEIEVLGTSFNVNAYSDEPAINTTLLSGRVKIVYEGIPPVILHPDQECVLKDGKAKVNNVNVESAVAWTHGMFNFKSADLAMVMRQVSRWYDVDIKYNQSVNARFSGSVYRSEDFSELLKIIEFTSNVKFVINGKTITVSSK